MNKQIEIYKERVKKLIDLLNQKDPNWISHVDYNKLLDFELGDDFFAVFFIKNNDKLTEIQNSVIIPWVDSIISGKETKDEDEFLEATGDAVNQTHLLGTNIDFKYLSLSAEEIIDQQKYLDYAWWISIKKIIYPTLNSFKKLMDKKELELKKSIN
jgi:hypothetical protein